MIDVLGFESLKVGQRVKVEGRLSEDGSFTATEITNKVSDEFSSIIGLIQEIDYENRRLQVCNRTFLLSEDVKIKDLLRLDTDFSDLKAETVVKVKGSYSPEAGLSPHLVKMKETFGYDIDKLKGHIDAIDATQKTFLINGYQVQVNTRTVIEGI